MLDPDEISLETISDGSLSPPQHHPAQAAAISEARRSAQRSVSWHKKPTYMVLFAVLGIAFAATHHTYYSYLDGKQAGSKFQKQVAVTIGNLLAFCVVSSFLAANCAAYPQYLWMSIRRKAFTLNALDKMFALTSDPTGFRSTEIFRHAPIVALLAIVYWYMTYYSITQTY